MLRCQVRNIVLVDKIDFKMQNLHSHGLKIYFNFCFSEGYSSKACIYIRLFFWTIMPKLKGKKLKVLRKLKAIFPLKLKVSEVFLPIFSKTQGTGGFWGYQRGLKSKNISWITYIKAEKGYFVKCRAVLNKLKGFLRKTQGFCRKNSIFSQKTQHFSKTQQIFLENSTK